MERKLLSGLLPADPKQFHAERAKRLKSLPKAVQNYVEANRKAKANYNWSGWSQVQKYWAALTWEDVQSLIQAVMPGVEAVYGELVAIPATLYRRGFWLQLSYGTPAGKSAICARILTLIDLFAGMIYDPVALAKHVGHFREAGIWNTSEVDVLLAASMNTPGPVGDEVFSILVDSARAVHGEGVPSTEGLQALMLARRPEAGEFMAKFLLAAQREEGLRQAIVSFLPQAYGPTRSLLLQTILEHDLVRFSSVVLALNQALGLSWDSQSQKSLQDALELWVRLDSDRAALESLLKKPESAQQLWIALRVAGMGSAVDPSVQAELVRGYCTHGNADIRYLGLDFLAAQHLRRNLPAVVEMFADPEARVAAHAMHLMAGHDFASVYEAHAKGELSADEEGALEFVVPECWRSAYGLPEGKGLAEGIDFLRVIQRRGAELAKENFTRFPGKTQKYTGHIWPWVQVECSQQLAANRLNGLLPEDDLGARAPYLAAMGTYVRSNVAERLGKISGTLSPANREIMMTLLTDLSADVRETALRSAKKHKILGAEAPLLEKALNRKATDLRRALIGLLVTLPEGDGPASCGRLLQDKDGQRRLAGLELARRLVEKGVRVEEVREAVRAYKEERGELPEQEQIQVAFVLGENPASADGAGGSGDVSGDGNRAGSGVAAGLAPTEKNGFLLYDQTQRTAPPLPKRPAIVAISSAARNIVESLDALILKHKEASVPSGHGGGKILLGEAYGLTKPKTHPGQTPDVAEWPLAEVWLDWWNNRPAECRDGDGLELLRAQLLLSMLPLRNSGEHAVHFEHLQPVTEALLGEGYRPVEIKAVHRWGGNRVHQDVLAWLFVHQDLEFWKRSDLWHGDLMELCSHVMMQHPEKAFHYGKTGKRAELREHAAFEFVADYFLPTGKTCHLWHGPARVSGGAKSFACADESLAARIWLLQEWLCRPLMPAPAGHPQAGQIVPMYQVSHWLSKQQTLTQKVSSVAGSLIQSAKVAMGLAKAGDNSEGSEGKETDAVDSKEAPLPQLVRAFVPSLEFLGVARKQGVASRVDIFHAILRRAFDNTRAWNHRTVLSRLTARRHEPLLDYCPELGEVAGIIRDVLVAMELRRGEEPTEASAMAVNIQCLPGIKVLIRILSALGTTDFKRNSLWGTRELDRPTVFGHLIKVSLPRREETPEEFARLVREAKIPERRLIELAMFSPHWAGYCEHALGLPGFEDAVWWIHGHVKDSSWTPAGSMREEWKAIISERTSVPADDLADGAVDAQWFADTTARLGHKPWESILKVAKYATDGGTGHSRATLFASAMLGAVSAEELTTRITTKRNQDSVRALGLAVLPEDKPENRAAREAEILARYGTLTEFLRTSKQFGSQRRESEKKAYTIALDNLARNAGYADPMRLQWALETKTVADLAEGPITITAGEASVTLSVDEMGDPEITFQSKGKAAKSLPAGLKGNAEAKALQERKTQLKRQASRMRKSLEDAMVNGDEFTGAELVALMGHALMAPRLGSLVFLVEGSDLMGTPVAGGRELEDVFGKSHGVDSDARVRIAHPLDLLKTGNWTEWQQRTFQRELVQPFKQVFREVYVPTGTELEGAGVYSLRYAGHQVNPRQAQALLSGRGWVMAPEEGCRRTFHHERITARMDQDFTFFTAAEVEGITIEGVYFTKAGDWNGMKLSDVPQRVFSEAMRDMDLVVSVAHRGDADPEASASTVEVRAALVAETARLLKLDNVRVEDRRVLIQGSLGDYSVHLGSGVSHRLPGGALFIVPVQAGHRGRLFLPFADDDPKSAQILSTVLLLARDKEIKDPYLRGQLGIGKTKG